MVRVRVRVMKYTVDARMNWKVRAIVSGKLKVGGGAGGSQCMPRDE